MKKLILSFTYSICSLILLAQTKTINVTVKTVSGEVLPGITILNAGTQKPITVTNKSGKAVLQAEVGERLLLKGLHGESVEFIVKNTNDYEFEFKEKAQHLDEVVVTALGIKRTKNTLPYAAQQLSSDDLNRTPNTNFIHGLSGKIAGLQVNNNNTLGGTSNVILRGFKSLTQNNQALFVVDGVPIDNANNSRNGLDLGNAASDINPEDIASISVLKGAAASALYGSRALNGVILITTKKSTDQIQKTEITLNQSLQTGFIDGSTLPKYQDLYGQGKGSVGYNSKYPDQSGYFYYVPAIGSQGNPVPVVVTNQDLAWGPRYNKDLNVYNWNSFVPGDVHYGKASPWVASPNHKAKDYFDTPFGSNTSLFVNAKQANSNIKVGYTNTYEKGIAPNSAQKKNIFNIAASTEISTKIALGASINYSNVYSRNRSTYDYRAANSNVRDLRQWNPTNIDYNELRQAYKRGYNASWNIVTGNYTDESGQIIKPAYHNNPYWNDYENYNNDDRDRYFGHVFVNYKITDGLLATARVSRDSYTQKFENRIAVGSYQTAAYARSNVNYFENNFDLLLNYDKQLNADFDLHALAGTNIRRNNTQSVALSTSGGLTVPNLYSISNSVGTPSLPIEYDGTKQVNGYFAGANIGYKELLALDVTGRIDKSSALPKANNQYFYPSIAGSFSFAKLLPTWTWLNFGKIRLNYAEVGGDAPIYSVLNTYVPGTVFNGQNIFSNPLTNNNPNLKPERNKSYEAGLELALLKNRIQLDITYYKSKLSDQITPITPSSATGYTNFYVNGGTIQNSGVEISLNATPVIQGDFKYDLTINWSKNTNKVISLYAGQTAYTIASYHNSVQLVAEVGKPYGILRGSDFEYVNGQRLVDDKGYYVKSANKNSNIGNINPDWIGGITNRFAYKNLQLSFLIDFSKGGDVYSLDIDNGSRSGILAETALLNDQNVNIRESIGNKGGIILPGVKKDGKPNDTRIDISDANKIGNLLPFGSTNGMTAKAYVFDASYIKLREVAFTYALPAHVFEQKSIFKGLSFSLAARNLWIIHKNLPYADPEQGAPSTTQSNADPMIYQPNASIGYQNGVFPSVRSISFSTRLTF